jgi:hypothetical protein
MAYHRFCCENSRYHHTMSNQLHMIRWVDDRRIEMLAEARPHWVPSMNDFEHAMWGSGMIWFNDEQAGCCNFRFARENEAAGATDAAAWVMSAVLIFWLR